MLRTPGSPVEKRAALFNTLSRMRYSGSTQVLTAEVIGAEKDELAGEEMSGILLEILENCKTEKEFVARLKRMMA